MLKNKMKIEMCNWMGGIRIVAFIGLLSVLEACIREDYSADLDPDNPTRTVLVI